MTTFSDDIVFEHKFVGRVLDVDHAGYDVTELGDVLPRWSAYRAVAMDVTGQRVEFLIANEEKARKLVGRTVRVVVTIEQGDL